MNGFLFANGNLVCQGILWEPHEVALSISVVSLGLTSAVAFVDSTVTVDLHSVDPSLAFAKEQPYGSMLWIVNQGANGLTLHHDSTADDSTHKIWTPSGSDLVLGAYQQAFAIYSKKRDGSRVGWWLFA